MSTKKMSKLKRLTATFMAVATCAAGGAMLGACAPDSGNLKIWWPGGSDATEAAIYQAKERYEAEHEGVKIDVRVQGTSDFYFSYNMALMGQDFPDIAYIDHVYVQRLAYDGLIANLTDYGADSLKDYYIDSLWPTTQYQGNTYALPMSSNVLTTAYNKALLTKVFGREFTDADYPTNWEEFIAIGEKIDQYNTANNLTGNDKLYLTTVPAGSASDTESMGAMFFMAYSAREGGRLMNEELTEMQINSDENKAAAAKIKYLGEHGYTPNIYSESGFENGKIAFIEMGPWKIVDYGRISQANDNCDLGFKPVFPLKDGGASQGALGLYSLVVSQKSSKKELAADFIKYLTTDDEIQLAHNTVRNLMPVTKTGLNAEYYGTPEWAAFKTQLGSVVARPGTAAWNTMQRSLAQYITELVAPNSERTPDYLDAIQIQLEEALEDLEDI